MKRQRQLTYNQAFAYFVTVTLSGFVELFRKDEYAQIVLGNLNHYRDKFEFRLLAYVIMPHHLHLVIHPNSKGNISEIMRDFKKYTAKGIIERLEEERQFKILGIFCEVAERHHPKESRKYQVWEDRFDDVALYSEEVLRTKVDYIHNNPVRAGLVDSPSEYPYSSARNYYFGDHSVIKVDCWEAPCLARSGRGPDTHRDVASPEEVVS
jgi:putative transposase